MPNFQRYFKEKITDVRNLNHKGNNKLFEIMFHEKSYLLKEYSDKHMDDWQRGKVEFSALSYLWARGFREIPQPISFYERDNVAIYSYERGITLRAEEIKNEQIYRAADFLAKLHCLNNMDKSSFNPASSACLSLQDYIHVLDRRFAMVSAFTSEDAILKKARTFLEDKVYPTMQELKKEFSTKAGELNAELSLDSQVLTPADFGFHNILVSTERYTFVDFEYFGRDDPARQILDFLHHDKSRGIKKELGILFLKEYRKKAKPKNGFEKRLQMADPLVGMAWVLIYLNALSKDYQDHINFAQGTSKGIIEERLDKAKNKMNDLRYFKI